MRSKWLVVANVVLLFAGYVGSYCCMSVSGRYEPGSIGLNGVKLYRWAPSGFVKGFKWNIPLLYAYLPLYVADIRLWHNLSRAYEAHDQGYPINEVSVKDIGKVYRAWSAK